MAEKEQGKEVERIYIIPLRKPKHGRSSLAAPRAVKHVRNFLIHHMKVEQDKIWIDSSVNKYLWSHGKFKIPSKIRVRAVKFEDGVVEVTLPEIGEKKSRREILKEEREKKTPILRREEAEAAPSEGAVSGTEDYEIAPTADGDVKIKKKKEEKPKEPEEQQETEEKKEEKPKEKTQKKETAADKKKEEKKSSKKQSEKSPSKKTASKKAAKKPEKKSE
ncbi:MAG: 50S ribosomal protein L31e [Candidatus Thermoplasmatota archaeon]